MGDDDEEEEEKDDHNIVNPSGSGAGVATGEIKAGVVNPRSRSCRGCLFYSSFLRDNGQNPTCYGLSHITPHIYRTVGDSDRQATKDFKYACLGYGVHKELNSSSSAAPTALADQSTSYGELPLCATTTHHPAFPLNSATPNDCSQRRKLEEAVHAMPTPRPAASSTSGGAPGIPKEFSSRFFRCAGLVASAVIRNVGRVAGAARSTFDDIFYPDRRRPK
ncbi:hypothetical protein CY35_05G130000 [Sphagnum magellanicum]|nr:hypothetical protein CY35_05G130000 [Sphagnum magellanicum]